MQAETLGWVGFCAVFFVADNRATSIAQVNAKPTRVVFVLWGKAAQAKRALITAPQPRVVECGHPSPLSARFFMGCRCFSKINAHLAETGQAPMRWEIADV